MQRVVEDDPSELTVSMGYITERTDIPAQPPAKTSLAGGKYKEGTRVKEDGGVTDKVDGRKDASESIRDQDEKRSCLL